jgi:16S rRNA (cytosine967-C5)-methyltransferase
MLDVPCSGLGSLRRRPEKRWRVTPEDIERLAKLQSAMLAGSASLVRVGGRVVYSTCTVSRAENQDIVSAFLERAGGAFRTADMAAIVPEGWRGDITDEGWFQSTPRVGGPDGHFVAMLERVR